MSKNISISVAKDDDYEVTIAFLREFYYKEEPITVAHPEPGHTKDDEKFTMSPMPFETILIARDADTGVIVGALSAGPIEHGDADKMIEDAKTTETEKWRDISLLLAYIEKKSDVLNRFSLEKALHIHALGVHHGYRGQGIGVKLFDACFENAKRLNYPMVSTDCTSFFSAKIAERVGMELVSLATYDEYNKTIEMELFSPTEPNSVIGTYVKKIE